MIKKIFLDANIILDLIDIDRGNLEKTRAFILRALKEGVLLSTSCDILSTVYYVAKKRIDKQTLVQELATLMDIFEIDVIDKDVIMLALEKNTEDLKLDFEDVLQSVCANMHACDILVTNDKTFLKEDMLVLTLDEAMEKL